MINRIVKKLNINIDTEGVSLCFKQDKAHSLLIASFKDTKLKNIEDYDILLLPLWNSLRESFPNVKYFAVEVNETKENSYKLFKTIFNLNYKRKRYEVKITDSKIFIDTKFNVNSKYDKETIKIMLSLLNIKQGYVFSGEEEIKEIVTPYSENTSRKFDKVKNYVETKIEDLPITEEMIEKFFVYPKIEGRIVSMDDRRTTKGISYIMTVTNYNESVYVKCFSQSEIAYKIGDSVIVSGKMMYDTYAKKVVLNAYSIEPSNKVFKEDEFDVLESEPMRAELHVHSHFDTQDSIVSPEEYYSNAKKLGISALAICDKENVQSFFESEEKAKEYDVKPIYGVELKVINDKEFKIFHERGSYDNTFVGLDIETTGLSNIFDEIIEISAYKVVDGKTLEYSCLVNLDSYKNINEISEFTTSLTSITNEMLSSEGVSIKDALNGLVDFIGNGIIVAHNADFDVPFIERKLKTYLNLEKKYSYIDTLNFAKAMFEMKSYTLDKVASKVKVSLEQHHRAIYDAKCCLDIFYALMSLVSETDIEPTYSESDETIYALIRTTNIKALEAVKDVKEFNLIYSNHDETTKACFENLVSFKHNKINALLNLEFKGSILKVYTMDETYWNNLNRLNEKITLNTYLKDRETHVTCIVKNQKGLKALYKLISLSHTKRIYSHGVCVLLSDILNNTDLVENALFGSSCSSGIFKKIYLSGKEQNFPLDLFDYFEIQPIEAYYNIDRDITDERIKYVVKYIMKYAKEHNKLVCFDTDAHYLYKKDVEIRKVLVNTALSGGVFNPHSHALRLGEVPMYSTSALIKKMSSDYELDATPYVCDNTLKIASQIENINIAPTKLYIPTETFLKDKKLEVLEGRNITNIKDEFERLCNLSLEDYKINGSLPEYVSKRADREMKSIEANGYHIIYYISYLLVKKSNMDGYVVGSRGSVGSSFVANLMGITEVNALKPHYRCPKCHYQIYKDVPSFVKIDIAKESFLRGNLNIVSSGFDLKDAECPCCQTKMLKDGQDIPFETFLGFNGDKVPDIDLNFASVYQAKAHLFTKELFGENNVVRAGTISKFADKTAYTTLEKYYKENNIDVSSAEIERRSQKVIDVKRTTGQHASGIVIIPEGMEYEDFVPIQYPANKSDAWITTHFDYKSIHDNLLKLDILGHVDPTVLKALMEEVKKNPSEYPFKTVKEIPFVDEKIFDLLRKDSADVINALGISEFGTKFVMGMLKEININSFADLVKVSGLSHGTDVWQNNSQVLVAGTTDFGTIPFKDVIGCRDDIMVQLLEYKLEPKDAFDIMEFVRKGKVQKDGAKWEKYKTILKEHSVPDWYIWSLSKIKYMFPKAHAVAYVMSALRIAWFKAYKPLIFYKVYMSIRDKKFDTKTICTNDISIIDNTIEKYTQNRNISAVDFDKVDMLQMAREMISLGYTFLPPSINHSHSSEFLIVDNTKLLVPYNKIDGVGDEIANSIYEARKDVPYKDEADLRTRGKANKKFIDGCINLGVYNFD